MNVEHSSLEQSERRVWLALIIWAILFEIGWFFGTFLLIAVLLTGTPQDDYWLPGQPFSQLPSIFGHFVILYGILGSFQAACLLWLIRKPGWWFLHWILISSAGWSSMWVVFSYASTGYEWLGIFSIGFASMGMFQWWALRSVWSTTKVQLTWWFGVHTFIGLSLFWLIRAVELCLMIGCLYGLVTGYMLLSYLVSPLQDKKD